MLERLVNHLDDGSDASFRADVFAACGESTLDDLACGPLFEVAFGNLDEDDRAELDDAKKATCICNFL
jgi:hypothetical protein